MERRDFLKLSALASSSLLVPSFLKGMENINLKGSGYKHLVIIQLSGGNDGLNTVIPFSQSEYYRLRPSVGITGAKVLKLTQDLGLNPALKGMRALYDNSELCILNSVGYPNPNRSHFRSMDIWHTGSNSNEYWTSGWLGRYMDSSCSNTYNVVEIDKTLSLALKGNQKNALAFTNTSDFYKGTREAYMKKLVEKASSETLGEDNLGYLYKTLIDTSSSATFLHDKTKTYTSKQAYPRNKLAQKLKTSAELINSGVETKVHYMSHSGFDTHAFQQQKQGNLLKQYDEAITAFVKDLKENGTFNDTLILTFSEFGRRVKENGSKGTDHGTANNLFVIGGNLNKAGFYNSAPDLLSLDGNGDLIHQLDFRQVYATVIEKWLGADSKKVLGKDFQSLNFL